MKMLIAEDDRSSRLLLSKTLERWGYDVTTAVDGEAAWQTLSQEPVELVISDWEMPGLDGPSLCRRIRERKDRGYVYVLLLTSRSDPSHLVEGLGAGADDFLTKPFNPAELQARLGVGRRILALQDELAAKNAALSAANAQLARMAGTDALTDVGNRRSFEDACRRHHETGSGCAALMIDVDHFKSVNDRHGHAVGDRVLASVALAVRGALGDVAELYRYGGEEFVALVQAHTADEASELAERARLAISRMVVDHGGTSLAVTASIGVSCRAGTEPWSSVVGRADEALYRAKREGRNCVRVSDGSLPEAS